MRHRRCLAVVILTLAAHLRGTARAAEPFPPEALPGQAIGGSLPAGYESSGLAWHSRLDRMFLVSDGGIVSSMNADGSCVVNQGVSGDLESVCVAHPASNIIYLGIEHPDSICEYNFVTGQVLRTFDLTPWMTGPDNSGLEALTFVPDAGNPEGGLFYAGLQNDGIIYKFQLPIVSNPSSTAVVFKGSITPVAGRTDISGLDYDADHQVLYAIFDTSNFLRAMKADGTFLREWTLPGSDQEGLSLHGNALYIAEDYGTGGNVIRYAPFQPVPEPPTLVLLAVGTMIVTLYVKRP